MDDRAIDKFIAPERIVRPRRRTFQPLPVIAIYDGEALNEAGELRSEKELLRALPQLSSRLFVRMDAAAYVAKLDKRYRKHYPGTWNCRFVTKESSLITPHGYMRATREQVVCHYFGWQTSGKGAYHRILDPFIFLEKTLPEHPTKPYIQVLLEWAVSIRGFCHENGLEVRSTAGAISGQFLTDPRFYPDARRKVPAATNKRVREALPGNYYSLGVVPEDMREYNAYYLDQHGAHHYHAARIQFPHSDELYAYGRFADNAKYAFDTTWTDFYGLYCLDLQAPARSPRWVRDWLDHTPDTSDPLTRRYVYSNELRQLFDYGYTVLGVRAAWGSHKRDTGLNKYAAWSLTQLDKYQNSPGIKRLLLATYGILAVSPTDSVSLYARATKGELASVRIGRETFTGHKIARKIKLEPRIANVLHRGMIEAECRSESIGYADYLDRRGYNVLSIYSDAVIVEDDDDQPLPTIPDPWRLKRTLHHLQFINTQAYKSAEETKIPGGVGREILRYISPQGTRRPPRPTNNKWADKVN